MWKHYVAPPWLFENSNYVKRTFTSSREKDPDFKLLSACYVVPGTFL